jgi:hypothetical protein
MEDGERRQNPQIRRQLHRNLFDVRLGTRYDLASSITLHPRLFGCSIYGRRGRLVRIGQCFAGILLTGGGLYGLLLGQVPRWFR